MRVFYRRCRPHVATGGDAIDTKPLAILAPLALVLTLASGCGGSSSSSTTTPGAASSASATAIASTSGAPSALVADATSAATGDIPDTQVYLSFTSTSAHWSMRYPEGWAQQGTGPDATFRDKNNVIHVAITSGPAPTTSSVAADIARLAATNPTLRAAAPVLITRGSTPVIKLIYTTQSDPNPVTGKRVLLIIDRFVLSSGGRVATIDLAAPQGVDNVDAYRRISESFQWK